MENGIPSGRIGERETDLTLMNFWQRFMWLKKKQRNRYKKDDNALHNSLFSMQMQHLGVQLLIWG